MLLWSRGCGMAGFLFLEHPYPKKVMNLISPPQALPLFCPWLGRGLGEGSRVVKKRPSAWSGRLRQAETLIL